MPMKKIGILLTEANMDQLARKTWRNGMRRSKSTGLESHRFNHADACQNHLVRHSPTSLKLSLKGRL